MAGQWVFPQYAIQYRVVAVDACPTPSDLAISPAKTTNGFTHSLVIHDLGRILFLHRMCWLDHVACPIMFFMGNNM